MQLDLKIKSILQMIFFHNTSRECKLSISLASLFHLWKQCVVMRTGADAVGSGTSRIILWALAVEVYRVWNDAKGFFYRRSHVLPLGMPLKKIACASNKISFISTPSMAGFTLPPVNRRLPVIFPIPLLSGMRLPVR